MKRSISMVTAAALGVATVAASAQPADEPLDMSGVMEQPNIQYAVVDGHALLLDLYLPAAASDPPLLVWIHGGGWQRGARKPVSTVEFVRGGYAMASIDYRLSPVAAFPAQSHDIKGAIRFLRANAGRFGYDADRIGVLGVSAGAHLAALAGVTNGHSELEGDVGGNAGVASDVQAIVSYFGASNLTTILDQSTPFGLDIRVPGLALLLGGSPDEKPDLAQLASPVFHVDRGDPPLLLLHGDQDPQMPINQSHELEGAYRDAGLDVAFEVVHGSPHGGEAFFDAERTALVQTFLDRHLRGSSSGYGAVP
jgi:acetyl esterase/lipase